MPAAPRAVGEGADRKGGLRRVAGRLAILALALVLPLLAAVVATGSLPRSLSLTELEAWSPVRAAGPGTRALARAATALVGLGGEAHPDWLTPADIEALQRTAEALRADRLRAALGELLILSDRLEARGRSLDEVVPLLMPDLAAYVLAVYFAPVLLGGLGVLLIGLVLLPWLVRRLYDLVKLTATLMLAGALLALLVALGIALAGRPILVFTLIEYLVAVAVLAAAGNLGLLLWRWRGRPAPRPGPVRDGRDAVPGRERSGYEN